MAFYLFVYCPFLPRQIYFVINGEGQAFSRAESSYADKWSTAPRIFLTMTASMHLDRYVGHLADEVSFPSA